MSGPFIALVSDAVRLLRNASATGGLIRLGYSEPDLRYTVNGVEIARDAVVDVRINREYEALSWGDADRWGQWSSSADPALCATYLQLIRRPTGYVRLDELRRYVPGLEDPGNGHGLLLLRHDEIPAELASLGMPDFTGWILDRNGAAPFQVHAEPDALGAIQLGTGWPLQGLQSNTVSVIGTGSIGSAATRALADVGIGTINLIDPDRLLWHNIVRHQLGPSAIGRYKVDALADALRDRSRPNAATGSTSYRTHRVDAVEQAADLFPLIHRAQVVLCAADGIAPRRVVNHLARLAGTPAIFACVLDDGSVGEIFRSRPGTKFGCLLCHRAWLAEQGWMDPEADQELAYGTGTSHKPMTAVPSDLQLIGQLAAQITLATLLESRHGRPGASLPNEHAVIGLRPTADLGGPFNVAHAGEVRWASVPPPRTDCPTCSLAN